MRAVKRFYGTNKAKTESRWFEVGQVVPPEFLATIGKAGLVDGDLERKDEAGEIVEVLEVPEFPTFKPNSTVEATLAWVAESVDYDERVARANHALAAEKAGKNRATLLEALPKFDVDNAVEE